MMGNEHTELAAAQQQIDFLNESKSSSSAEKTSVKVGLKDKNKEEKSNKILVEMKNLIREQSFRSS